MSNGQARPSLPTLRCTYTVDRWGVAHIVAAGEIDMATAPQFQQTLRSALAEPAITQLRVDFRRVDFMDCCGAAALAAARNAARRRAIGFLVTNAHGAARIVLDILELRRH